MRWVVTLAILLFSVDVTNATAQGVAGNPGSIPQSSGQITGVIVDENGGAVAGAKVFLVNAQGATERTVVSDASGHFSFSGLAIGKFTILIEQNEFARQEVAVEASASAPTTPLRITLHVASVRQSITVSGSGEYAVPDASGGTKTDTLIMETPVSVQVIPQQVLADQQTVRLGDALQNVSGVIPANDSYGTNDSFTIRGFDQLDLTYEDGLRLDQYSNAGFPLDFANIEKIEVVKGPASVLYGQAEPGGMVNIVTKQPLEQLYYSSQQQFGSYGFYRTTLDATGPLFTKSLFYRFNLDYENAGSFRDFIHTDQVALFPTIQWKPNKRDQIAAQLMYATGTIVTDNGIPLLMDGTPAKVPIGSNYAEPDSNRTATTQYSVKLLGTHEFSDAWKLTAAYKAGYYDAPDPNSVFYFGDADANGDLHRIAFTENFSNHWTHQVIADLTDKFTIHGVKNTLLAGLDFYYQYGRYDANLYFPAPINIFKPIYGQPFIPPDPANDTFVHNGQQAYGAYLQDQVALPARLFLLAGFRFDRVNSYNSGYGPSSSSIHDRPAPTPRAGILWQPVQTASVYFSYSGNYGATPLGAITPDGKPLPPQSAQQYEFGVKTEWLNKRLSATTSIYQITKQNIPTTDPSNPIFSVAIGEARSRGFEVDVSGQITPNWKIIGGYSYIDGVVAKDDNVPSLAGLRFPGAPRNSGSFWSVYEIPGPKLKGLRFGAGVVGRTSEVAYESPDGVTNLTDRIPGFAIVNAMMAYTRHFERATLSAQLNINNLLDHTYFSAVNPSRAMPGAPTTMMPAIRVEF